ncbi:MAG: C40 family peptidase [Acidimicrobiales bacterium]
MSAQLNADATKLDALDQQFDAAQQRVAAMESKIATVRATIATDQSQVATDELSLRQAALDQYMNGTSAASLDVFTFGGSSAAAAQEYRTLATADLSSAVDGLRNAQQQLAQQQARLGTTEASAQAALDQVAAARSEADRVLGAQQATLSSLQGQVAALVAADNAAREASAAATYKAGRSGSANLPASSGGQGAVRAAESQIGVPYQWGAESPGHGFDCSGLTQWSWRQVGVSLPRTAEGQREAVPSVSWGSIEPGDLIFWGSGGSATHVAIYVGNGDVVNAPGQGQDIKIQPIWYNGLMGAGRP